MRLLTWSLLLSVLTALILTATGGGAVTAATRVPDTHRQGTVQLVFRQFDPPSEIGGLIRAVDAWNRVHPGIHVQLDTLTGATYESQYAREVQAGGGPDVLQLGFVQTLELAKHGLLEDLTPYVKASPPGKGIGDFRGTDLGELNGKLYGIPWTNDTFALAYRPDILKAAGIRTFPDTWGQLLTTAEKLSHGNTYGFCFPAASSPDSGIWFLVNYYLWSNGTSLVHKTSSGQWTVGASAHDLANAMAYFNAFFVHGATPKSAIGIASYGDPEFVGGLGRGECAISFFPPQTFRQAEKQSSMPLRTAPIPRGSVRRISHLGGRALGIDPRTKHPQEAWMFLKYLVSARVMAQLNQYPAQASLLDKTNIPASEQGYKAMLPHAITFKQYIESPAPVSGLQSATNRALGAVFSGQSSASQSAADLVTALQGLLQQG